MDTKEPPRLYLSPPHLSGAELGMLEDAVRSNWIAPLGPHVDAFEAEVVARTSREAAVALSSGTAALHLALEVAGVGAGDDVWVSSLTFAATANAVTYTGARPVFIDSNRATWNMDPELVRVALEAAQREGTLPRAAIIVDIYGQCADYDQLLPLFREHDVVVIEDAAESLGATYRGQPAGSFGDFAILSFNGNKIITTSGGGMLLSNDREAIEAARHLSTQARDPAPHYQHSKIGYNYRLSNLLSAVGRAQLAVLDERVAARRQVNQRYREALTDLPGVEFMPEADYGECTFWLTCLTIDANAFGATSTEVRLALEAQNIEARPVWKPLHLQPVFAECPRQGGDVSRDLFERGLCLPSGSAMTVSDARRVTDIVKACRRSFHTA